MSGTVIDLKLAQVVDRHGLRRKRSIREEVSRSDWTRAEHGTVTGMKYGSLDTHTARMDYNRLESFMESNFWHERWQRGEIGFHRSDIHWALEGHWAEIAQERSGAVLVPLCGKSLDMRWLARAGHEVVGIELSRKAIREFYEEWDKKATQTPAGALNRWQANGVALLEGDFFAYRPETPFELFYDRAALIALPPDMRKAYLDHWRSLLTQDAQGLLVTFEYDQAQMDGPPFSVPAKELYAHPGLAFELIERRDTLGAHPGFAKRGLSALRECAWRVSVV